MALWQTLSTLFHRRDGSAVVRQDVLAVGATGASGTLAGRVASGSKRLTLDEQFARMRRVIETATDEAQSVQVKHVTARSRIDATELSLRRMLAEIEDIMPVLPMVSLGRSGSKSPSPVRTIALAA